MVFLPLFVQLLLALFLGHIFTAGLTHELTSHAIICYELTSSSKSFAVNLAGECKRSFRISGRASLGLFQRQARAHVDEKRRGMHSRGVRGKMLLGSGGPRNWLRRLRSTLTRRWQLRRNCYLTRGSYLQSE